MSIKSKTSEVYYIANSIVEDSSNLLTSTLRSYGSTKFKLTLKLNPHSFTYFLSNLKRASTFSDNANYVWPRDMMCTSQTLEALCSEFFKITKNVSSPTVFDLVPLNLGGCS